jgi:hypothetical protein
LIAEQLILAPDLTAAECKEAIGSIPLLIFEPISFPHWDRLTRNVIEAITIDLGNGGARREPRVDIIEGQSCHIPGRYHGYRMGWHAWTPEWLARRWTGHNIERFRWLISPQLAYPEFPAWAAGYVSRVIALAAGDPVARDFAYEQWWL